MEEAKLLAPITWKQLSDGFYERFFPKTAMKDMEEQFIALQQGGRSVDAYAAEFLRLSRFALNLVSTEECRADRFMQGLQIEIQVLLSGLELTTYSAALTVARRVERAMRKDKSQTQKKAVKRPFDQMTGGTPQDFGATPARRL